MEDKLKSEIAGLVANIFESKKEEEQRKKTKQALETAASSIDDLTTKVNENEEVVTSLESEKAELEAQAASAKEEHGKEVEALKVELETAKEQAATSKTELETVSVELKDLKQEAVASIRMKELETAGVLRDDIDAQKGKVKDMSEEDFTSYKEELAEVRKSILDQLEVAKKAEEAKAAAAGESQEDEESEEAAAQASASEKDKEKKGITTKPAEISPGKAIASAMNLEVQPSDDITKQYQAMGAAMAANIKEESK